MSAPAIDLRCISPASYRTMPWKNGLGTTTEIAVEPEGAPLDAFTWRISTADVVASGPFSRFPGHHRILVQIDGAPMTLSHEGAGEHRLSRLVPYGFAGELATHCTVAEPPARDFNVIVRRDVASARVWVHELAAGAKVSTAGGDADTRIGYVLEGAVSAETARSRCAATADETLVARGAAAPLVTATVESVVLIVEIGPPGRF